MMPDSREHGLGKAPQCLGVCLGLFTQIRETWQDDGHAVGRSASRMA